MADYKTLIDAEIWAFIEKTDSHYPPETATFGVEDQRRIYDEMCAAFRVAYPIGVSAIDRDYGGVPCRHYTSGTADVAVMYYHGGGFVVGGLESHDDVCAEICAASGFDVISVDYRMAPEHKHPAMFEDAMAATRAVADELGKPLVLCGDSAGGNLAAAVSHMARGTGLDIRGQVLVYPGLGGDYNKGSYVEYADAPMLTRDDIVIYKNVRLAGEEPVGDPRYAPLHDSDFAGLPPTVINTAQCDPLSDDGVDYQRALKAAGVPVHHVDEPGLVHGHMRARHMSARSSASFERIKEAVTALGKGKWPYA
ncbi:MAG: alpha/beta hydrolase [Planktotalea sp.]|uniref:alpha/beta hydrolase n=1 Tax=Planktotalea sp. TaxID=2029877 RepID=UPI003C71E31A